jgi:hypothetical protein
LDKEQAFSQMFYKTRLSKLSINVQILNKVNKSNEKHFIYLTLLRRFCAVCAVETRRRSEVDSCAVFTAGLPAQAQGQKAVY